MSLPPDDLSRLRTVLNISERNFLMIAHRGRSDGKIQINDLCGASGRWDGIARTITASLFLSHDMRRDTSVHILLLGPDDPPKLLSVNGKDVRYLNPDERASSALMRKCLTSPLGRMMGDQVTPSHGICITRADLQAVIGSLDGEVYLMDENGELSFGEAVNGSVHGSDHTLHFILSDDLDMEDLEKTAIMGRVDRVCKLGKRVLHSNQAVTIIHYLIDEQQD